MKTKILLLLACILPTQAMAIDLKCETLAADIVTQLVAEGLLLNADKGQQRAQAISMAACNGAEVSAQQQHEQTLKNWLTESTGGKVGNKRLRNLKR